MKCVFVLSLVVIFCLMGCDGLTRNDERAMVRDVERIVGETASRAGNHKAALDELRAYAKKGKRFVRGHVAWRLPDATKGGREADIDASIEILSELLQDPELSVRKSAAESLGIYGRKAVSALSLLCRNVIENPDTDLAWNAVGALGEIRIVNAEVIHALSYAIRHEANNDVYRYTLRQKAARASGEIGGAAYELLPLLREYAEIGDRSCRDEIAEAIWKIDQ